MAMASDGHVPKNPGKRDDRAVGGLVLPEVSGRFSEPRAEGGSSVSVSEFGELCGQIRGEPADLSQTN